MRIETGERGVPEKRVGDATVFGLGFSRTAGKALQSRTCQQYCVLMGLGVGYRSGKEPKR